MPPRLRTREDRLIRANLAFDITQPGVVLRQFDEEGRRRLWEALDELEPRLRANARRALALFSCVMDILGISKVPSTALSDGAFTTLQRLWYGALYSPKFSGLNIYYRHRLARRFAAVVRTAGLRALPVAWGVSGTPPQDWIREFERRPIHAERVRELNGRYIQDKYGEEIRISLRQIARVLGSAFEERLHVALSEIAKARAENPEIQLFTQKFESFVGQYKGPLTLRDLQNPVFMKTFFTDWMFYHFEENVPAGKQNPRPDTRTLQVRWGHFRGIIRRLGKETKLWAVPKSLPPGKPSLAKCHTVRHVRNAAGGAEGAYTQKLITPIPLSVTDAEAYQLLFQQIEADAARVKMVLQKEVDRIWADYQAGKALEERADPAVVTNPTPALFRRTRCPNALANFIRAFRCQGYVDTTRGKYRANLPFWDRWWFELPYKRDVARFMGFLGAQDAMIFAARLMSLAPACTTTALLTAEVFSRSGARIGITDTDAGCYLSVRKARGDRPQNVLLKGEAERLVGMLLELTEPLRRYMRREHLKGWQNLFLYSSTPLGTPLTFTHKETGHDQFRQRIRKFRAELGPLVDTLTLSQIRSTEGVLTYLRTHSLDEMARILDHDRMVSLEHYLPEPLWRFFQDRWIRTFQNLLLQAAVKGSPHALAVSDLKTWNELETFLANNVLRDLPILTEGTAPSPDKAKPADDGNRILVIAAEKPWAALFSVRDAVRKSTTPERVHPRAWHWTRVADALEQHVRSETFTDKQVKSILANAIARVDAGPFQAVVHA